MFVLFLNRVIAPVSYDLYYSAISIMLKYIRRVCSSSSFVVAAVKSGQRIVGSKGNESHSLPAPFYFDRGVSYLLLAHEHRANGLLHALRHAADMERRVICSLHAGLLKFEKHGAIATY